MRLDYIGRIYEVERELRERAVPATSAERLKARQQKSRPIMTEFRIWLDTIAPKLLPESKFGKAVHYALGQWSKLQVYLDDPAVPVDNNVSARKTTFFSEASRRPIFLTSTRTEVKRWTAN